MLPFTHAQFLDLFAAYNRAIWPAQIVAVLMGLLAIRPLIFRHRRYDATALVLLALMWLWTGIVYFWLWFTRLSPAGYLFGLIFVAGAITLSLNARHARLTLPGGLAGVGASALLAYSTILYPLVGLAFGHPAAAIPAFGVTPCPLTLFTFAILFCAGDVRRIVWVPPLLWSAIGGSAAFLLGIPQDWPLILAGAGLAAWITLAPPSPNREPGSPRTDGAGQARSARSR